MADVEQLIAQHLKAGDLNAAAVLVLRIYGPEVLGFLLVQLHDRQAAEEVFAMFSEDLWRALPQLVIHTSMRAYAYTLARNAQARFLGRDVRRARGHDPLSVLSERAPHLAAELRSQTAAYLRTANKDRLSSLRARLTGDEQALLTLRLDRGLDWQEIAHIFGEAGDARAAAARVRKRFQLLKDKLARLAREQGLLDDPGSE